MPAVPHKFLDIGIKMGQYHIEELLPRKGDKNNILHPRHTGMGIPPANTFHSVVQKRVGSHPASIDHWCVESAWFETSPAHDFRVTEDSKYRWGLPVLVPTCPKKMFAQGPRLKYVDIVTDTLHASSSDLITWNTLVMMKLRWIEELPRAWIDITTNSLETWSARDQLSPFRADNRRGYARVTPIAMSNVGMPGTHVHPVDECPTHGLGIYDDYETSEEFNGYIWATWTTMEAQPMQIDSAPQAMIDQSKKSASGQTAPSYDLGTSVDVDLSCKPMGSNEFARGAAAPFPDTTDDVSMESGADKRSRESPDSTLKPERKSLKTSESAAATTDADTCAATSGVLAAGNTKPSNVSKRPKSIPEAKFLMWEVHQRMPAWKAVRLIESSKDDQVDLAALGEATGILFESREMMSEAVQCLERIREQDGKKDDKSGARRTSDSPSVHGDDQEVSDASGSDDPNTQEESHDTPGGDASEKTRYLR